MPGGKCSGGRACVGARGGVLLLCRALPLMPLAAAVASDKAATISGRASTGTEPGRRPARSSTVPADVVKTERRCRQEAPGSGPRIQIWRANGRGRRPQWWGTRLAAVGGEGRQQWRRVLGAAGGGRQRPQRAMVLHIWWSQVLRSCSMRCPVRGVAGGAAMQLLRVADTSMLLLRASMGRQDRATWVVLASRGSDFSGGRFVLEGSLAERLAMATPVGIALPVRGVVSFPLAVSSISENPVHYERATMVPSASLPS